MSTNKIIIFKNGSQIITNSEFLLPNSDLYSIISNKNYTITKGVKNVEVTTKDNQTIKGKYISHNKKHCTLQFNNIQYVIQYILLKISNEVDVVNFESDFISYLTKSLNWISIGNAFIKEDIIHLSITAKIITETYIKGKVTLISNNLNIDSNYQNYMIKMASIPKVDLPSKFEHTFDEELHLDGIISQDVLNIISNVEKINYINLQDNIPRIYYKVKFNIPIPETKINVYENDIYIDSTNVNDTAENNILYLNGAITNKVSSNLQYTVNENVININGNITTDEFKTYIKYYIGNQLVLFSNKEYKIEKEYIVYQVDNGPIDILIKLDIKKE